MKRRRLTALTLVLLLAAVAWLVAHSWPTDFSFEAFEGDGSAARIWDAKEALEKIVPPGSTLAQYKTFFLQHGGDCGNVVDPVRFPHVIVCWYSSNSIWSGFVINSEWKYVIDYDPTTTRSKHTAMNFGLTGP